MIKGRGSKTGIIPGLTQIEQLSYFSLQILLKIVLKSLISPGYYLSVVCLCWKQFTKKQQQIASHYIPLMRGREAGAAASTGKARLPFP